MKGKHLFFARQIKFGQGLSAFAKFIWGFLVKNVIVGCAIVQLFSFGFTFCVVRTYHVVDILTSLKKKPRTLRAPH
jgi:hypothetical protein